MCLTVEQVLAARALLRWSQGDLAKAAGVSEATIYRLESGVRLREVNYVAVRSVFEKAGIEFVGGGVRPREHDCA